MGRCVCVCVCVFARAHRNLRPERGETIKPIVIRPPSVSGQSTPTYFTLLYFPAYSIRSNRCPWSGGRGERPLGAGNSIFGHPVFGLPPPFPRISGKRMKPYRTEEDEDVRNERPEKRQAYFIEPIREAVHRNTATCARLRDRTRIDNLSPFLPPTPSRKLTLHIPFSCAHPS